MPEYLGLNGYLKAFVNEAGRRVDLNALSTGQSEPEQVRPTPAEWDIYEAIMDGPAVPLDAEWGFYSDEEAMQIPPAETNVRAVRYVSRTVPGYELSSQGLVTENRPAIVRHEATYAQEEFSGKAGTPVDVYTG